MTTDYFIVLGRSPADALVASFSSPSSAPKPVFPRSDAALVKLRFMRPNPVALAGRLFIDVPQTEVNAWPSVKFGGGVIGSQPNGGTFTLTDTGAAQTSGAEAYGITAAALQTNLRATLTTHFSTCTVTGSDGGPFSIEADATAGVTLTGSATQLAPDGSTIQISKTQNGNGSGLKNRWIVTPTKALPILCIVWSPFPDPLVTPTILSAGSGTVCKSYTVTWNSDAYDGAVYLTYYNGSDTFTIGPISYNAGTADIASLFAAQGSAGENTVAVAQNGPGSYTITFIGTANGFSNTPTLANNTNTLQVPAGLTGVAQVSTSGASDILASDPTGAITLEIEIQPASGQVTTAAQVDATIDADLIGNTPGFATGTEDWATIGDVENISEHIFANNAGRLADSAYRRGQIGFQTDTGVFWWAQTTDPGDWDFTFQFGGISLGLPGTSGGQMQLLDSTGTFATVFVAPNGTATRTLTAPDTSGTLALADWLIKTTTYPAKAYENIQADTSGSAWTLTLPAGTLQVETATAVGTITGSGNATVVVTAAGVAGSPVTVPVAVTNTDTAATWAGKVRTALGLNAAITAVYTVGGSTTAIALTKIAPALANDSTLNISLANGTCTGITAAPTSANTTPGVADPTTGTGIRIEDAQGTWASNNLTIARNGLKINGGTSNYTGNLTGQKLSLVYISLAYGWSIK